jgi:hypothetical protein
VLETHHLPPNYGGSKYQLRACRERVTGLFLPVMSAPEGIRTPNLLIRSQKQPAFGLFQGIPPCPDKPFSRA